MTCYGQLDCCVYSDKPVTKTDSTLWKEYNIQRIEKYHQFFNKKDTVKRLIGIDTISTDCLKLYCLETIKRIEKSKMIIEILEDKFIFNGKTAVKLKRIYFLDDEARIVKLKNKFLKGQRNEQWLFDHVDFEYKDGLLSKSTYYSKLYGDKKKPFLIIYFRHI
jgi:hypothetical protein